MLAKKADNAAAAKISRVWEAEDWAVQALRNAEAKVERYALYALAWARGLGGKPLDDLCARSGVAAEPGGYISASPERVEGKRLMWRGELERARKLLDSLLALADERGQVASYAMVRLHLCELELRAGAWERASRLLDEWAESSDYEAQFRPQYQRCRALLAAGRGDAEDAHRWAGDTLERAKAVGCRWDELEADRAQGMAALVEQAPERAVEELWPVWEYCEREGVKDPGAFPVAPELVEALVEVGELERAGVVSDRLSQLGEQQEHAWARASAKRCRALVLLSAARPEEAAISMRAAADELEALGLRFDSARSLLALGRIQRRARQWRAARETLEESITAFVALGCTGWAEQARSELNRIGGRGPRASGELTPSELRVAELAAQGLANKQIASALFVTVNTVEVHLARAYAKLGVRSRAQLAMRLRLVQ